MGIFIVILRLLDSSHSLSSDARKDCEIIAIMDRISKPARGGRLPPSTKRITIKVNDREKHRDGYDPVTLQWPRVDRDDKMK